MTDEKWFNLIIDNQNEIKADLKQLTSEVRKINGRVVELETHHFWGMLHKNWVSKVLLLVSGIVIGFIADHFIGL